MHIFKVVNWVGKFKPLFYGIMILFEFSCNKLVTVSNPISSVTANQVFSSDATATGAMLGIYSYMSSQPSFSNYLGTYHLGESADELTDEPDGNEQSDRFLINGLIAQYDGDIVLSDIWQPAYFDIYSANSIISGVQSSPGLTVSSRNQLIGEAKFIRAFCYFYLTNIFGDIPLDLSNNFNETVLLPRSPQMLVYQQIVNDLQNAQNLMISDFSLSNNMPIRANKWAATALLARVYQYLGQWQKADSAASAVINSGLFTLVSLPKIPEVPPNIVPDSDVFWANSREAILQLQTTNIPPYATIEGAFFNPVDSLSQPNCWLSTQILNAFENGDLRRLNWVDSSQNNGMLFYYPYKYKSMIGTANNIQENYTLLRLAEQYLIRAEAEVNLNQIGAAINDLDIVRNRAGLDSLSTRLTKIQLDSVIEHEFQIEFFAEWGHRWLDLKRWGSAISTLGTISYKNPNINSTQLLYPIPISEIQSDPNLKQNSGY